MPTGAPVKSCYVLEFSVDPERASHAEAHIYGDLPTIRDHLVDALAPDGDADPYAVALVLQGATLALWVVQRGVVVQHVDLRRFLTLVLDDRAARLDDPAALAPLEALFDVDPARSARFELDWAEVEAVTPPLERPVLRRGEVVDVTFAEGLAPGVGTYLSDGELEQGSWDLTEGDPLDADADADADADD